jgi:hypothetical protein
MRMPQDQQGTRDDFLPTDQHQAGRSFTPLLSGLSRMQVAVNANHGRRQKTAGHPSARRPPDV